MSAPLLLLLGAAWAVPHAVATGGGDLPLDGVVRVVFDDGVREVTVRPQGGEPVPLAEHRCTTGKDRDIELCAFDLPLDVPPGVLELASEGLSTAISTAQAVDIGTWSGTVELVDTTLDQRSDPGGDADFIDLDSTWSAPAAPAAGYLVEVRDENGRVVDWLSLDPAGPVTLVARTATETLTSNGEICLQARVFDPYDEEAWVGNRICTDMPNQPDPACRGCATGGGGAGLGLLLLPLLLLRRRP